MTALSVAKEELQRILGRECGWDRTPGNWTTNQIADAADIIAAGLRRFYFPPALPGEEYTHVWSFLRPWRTLNIWPTVTGMVSGNGVYNGETGLTTLTATAAKFHATMVGKTFTFDNGSDFTIAGYTSTTVITLTGDASGETADDTFTVTADGDYRLPDDFADIVGPMSFPVGASRSHRIEQRNIHQVTQRRASHDSSWTEQPEWFAIQAEDYVEGTGQRYYIALQGIPDKEYALEYKSAIEPSLVSAESYVRGGTPHVQTVIEAVLAESEIMRGDEPGAHYSRFMECLIASVAFDRQANAPDTLGLNRDRSGAVPVYDQNVRGGTLDVFNLFEV